MAFDQRILIAGSGKSGTSGLYAEVKAGAERHSGAEVAGLFEPHSVAELRDGLRRPLVAKMLLERLYKKNRDFSVLAEFERVILTVRDPRDILVSRLLWQLSGLPLLQDPERLATALVLIRQKEADPSSIGLAALYDQLGALGGLERWLERSLRLTFLPGHFLRWKRPDALRIAYEDFVAGSVGELEDYLGFTIVRGAPSTGSAALTLRTGSSGSWRRWFLYEDHKRIVSPNRQKFRALGYRDLDFVSDHAPITPDEASLYVARVAAWRAQKTVAAGRSGDDETGDLDADEPG